MTHDPSDPPRMNPRHDFDDPRDYLDEVEAAFVAVLMPKCPHCNETREILPMPGHGWAVEHFHETGCPDHEDNRASARADATFTDELADNDEDDGLNGDVDGA